MAQDDPEQRIAELERQLAEQHRIAELERQIAQAKAATDAQDVPMPAPQPGQPTGFKGAWVSVNGGGFQQVSGQGAGAVLPPQAAEQLAGLVNNIVRQAEFSGQGGFGGQAGPGAHPGQVGFGNQAGLGYGYQSPQRKVTGIPRKYLAIGFAALFTVVALPVLFAISGLIGTLLVAFKPSSVGWMSGIVCNSGYQLTPNISTASYRTRTSIFFQSVNGASTYDASQGAVMGLQTLGVALVALTLLSCIALAVWLPYRKRSPDNALHAMFTALTCGLWAPVWMIVAVSRSRRSGAGVSITR